MLDWSTCELEGFVWDEFSENDDHIVPHPGGEEVDSPGQVDCHKKPRCEESYPFISNSNSQYAAKDAPHRKNETSFATLKDQKAPMLDKGSWSCTTDGVFPPSCDADSIKGLPGFTAVDSKLAGNCFNGNHIGSSGNEFCADDSILGYRSAAAGSSLCQFPLGDISSAGSDLEFFANGHEDKENSDLLYYGWPDIGNFEDVDQMFRNCDSTFGQGDTSHENEFSCFSSSSHAINGPEEALKSGPKSSSSDSNELRSMSEYHESDDRFIVDTFTPLINDSEENSALNDYQMDSRVLDGSEPATLSHSSYVSWSDANSQNRGESMSIEQENVITGEVQEKMPSVSCANGGSLTMTNLHNQQLKHHSQSVGRGKSQSSGFDGDGPPDGVGPSQQYPHLKFPSSMPPSLNAFSALDIPQQQQKLGPNFSSFSHVQLPYVPLNPTHQVPVTPKSSVKTENNGHPSVSLKYSSIASNHAQPMEQSSDSSFKAPAIKSEKRVRKPFQQQQLHSKVTADPQQDDLKMKVALTNQTSNQKTTAQIQDEVGSHTNFVGKHIEIPAEDFSTERQSSCMSSALSDVVSLEETSFGKLQCIMEKLDIRTKMCIRDSLYRLARSAEQRHNIGSSNGCSRNCCVRTGVSKTEERCTEFVDMETGTNPIDRSIAHLLFHRPSEASSRHSEVSMRPTNDVLPQESQAMFHGSTSTQTAMLEKLASLEEIGAGAETQLHTDL